MGPCKTREKKQELKLTGIISSQNEAQMQFLFLALLAHTPSSAQRMQAVRAPYKTSALGMEA